MVSSTALGLEHSGTDTGSGLTSLAGACTGSGAAVGVVVGLGIRTGAVAGVSVGSRVGLADTHSVTVVNITLQL